MEIITSLEHNLNLDKPLTLAMGNFDGIHLGHQKMIDKVISYKDTKSALITFDPHPKDFFKNKSEPRLFTKEDKIEKFMTLGLDYLFLIDFNEDFSKISKTNFIKLLKKRNVKRVVLGKDARFGHKGEGTYKDLEKEFEVILMPDFMLKEDKVSTTYIKELLEEARLDEVKTCLGHYYKIKGYVEHGNKVGRTIGFPTANIDYKNYYLPKPGVYITRVLIDDIYYYGTTSIGNNPTLNYSDQLKLEVYLHGFQGDLYEKHLEVEFHKFLRGQIKFDDKNTLINQINDDINQTILYKNKMDMI